MHDLSWTHPSQREDSSLIHLTISAWPWLRAGHTDYGRPISEICAGWLPLTRLDEIGDHASPQRIPRSASRIRAHELPSTLQPPGSQTEPLAHRQTASHAPKWSTKSPSLPASKPADWHHIRRFVPKRYADKWHRYRYNSIAAADPDQTGQYASVPFAYRSTPHRRRRRRLASWRPKFEFRSQDSWSARGCLRRAEEHTLRSKRGRPHFALSPPLCFLAG